jgi:hypothetical protein
MTDNELGGALRELGRTLTVTYQAPSALRRLCAQLTGMLPVAGCYAVLLDESDSDAHVVAATDSLSRRIETLHAELGDGPCLVAARSGERLLLADLTAEAAIRRFPRFAPRATAAGVAAIYSFPLHTADQVVGSLSLCSDVAGDLSDSDLELVEQLVGLTAASVLGARHYHQIAGLTAGVQQRLADTIVLEQAKGRISEQLQITPEQALQCLHRHAGTTRVSLQVAAAQVASGTLRLYPDEFTAGP